MEMCTHQPIAIRIQERTLKMIAAENGGLEPQIEDVPTFFMIYCSGSDHEETAIIDEDTFNRTYKPMSSHVLGQFVTTID